MVFLKAHVSAPATVGMPFPNLCTTAKEAFFITTRGSRKNRLCPVENTDRYSGTLLMNPSGQPSSPSSFLKQGRRGGEQGSGETSIIALLVWVDSCPSCNGCGGSSLLPLAEERGFGTGETEGCHTPTVLRHRSVSVSSTRCFGSNE